MDRKIDQAIDNSEGIQMKIMRIFIVDASIGNLVILLLEEAEEPRAIVTAEISTSTTGLGCTIAHPP